MEMPGIRKETSAFDRLQAARAAWRDPRSEGRRLEFEAARESWLTANEVAITALKTRHQARRQPSFG